jgi:hypothetical protein
MAVNWGLSGGNGFQNALATGLQIGQTIKKDRDQQTQNNALSVLLGGGARTPGIGDGQGNADSALRDLAGVNPELAFKFRTQQAQQASAQVKAEADKREAAVKGIPTQINMLQQASPENWQQLRSQAISLGLATEQNLPTQFDPTWRDSQVKVLSAFREDPDLMTTEVKNVMATLDPKDRDPNSPVFRAAMSRSAEKVIALQAGGSAVAYNENTGQSRMLIAPNPGNAPAGSPVGSAQPETTKVINGKTYYNYGGTWHDEPMGGQTQPASGGFRRPVTVQTANFNGLAGETVTSTYRDPARNKRVGGVSNSYHMRRDAKGNPLARDSVPPRGMSMAQYAAVLRRENPDKDVINEGDHVHMEPRG